MIGAHFEIVFGDLTRDLIGYEKTIRTEFWEKNFQ